MSIILGDLGLFFLLIFYKRAVSVIRFNVFLLLLGFLNADYKSLRTGIFFDLDLVFFFFLDIYLASY